METMQRPATGAQVPMTPEEMLVSLRSGKKMSYDVTMGNMTIPMRVLSLDEEASIRMHAKKLVAQKGGDQTDQDIVIEKETIKMATTLGLGSVPMIGDIILNKMTADEHAYLYSEYINLRERVNPSLEQIGPDEFKALVECLKKNILSSRELSTRQLRAICGAFQEWIQRPVMQTSPQDS